MKASRLRCCLVEMIDGVLVGVSGVMTMVAVVVGCPLETLVLVLVLGRFYYLLLLATAL